MHRGGLAVWRLFRSPYTCVIPEFLADRLSTHPIVNTGIALGLKGNSAFSDEHAGIMHRPQDPHPWSYRLVLRGMGKEQVGR